MKLRTTNRGFVRGEFLDRYGSECSIQESSAMRDDGKDGLFCLWLGVDKDFNGEECTRMHLDESMVRALIPLLEEFLKTRRLPAPPSREKGGA